MGRYKRVMHFQSHSRRISECINFIKKKKNSPYLRSFSLELELLLLLFFLDIWNFLNTLSSGES